MKDLLIVVPYRNRQEHLNGFLENSPRYFDRSNITYDILICELDQKGDWNAGLCVNSLVKFINNERCYKYLYVHHVDVWPTEGDWVFPQDNEVYFNLGDYGSCVMLMEAFLQVGGYSNSFWGWGGEDNELYMKLQTRGYRLIDSEKDFAIKYETKFQNHERKFNGSNYGNGIKNLMVIPDKEKNNITNFDQHAVIQDLTLLKNKTYKQLVCPLMVSPREAKNDKIILGYLKNETDFHNIVSFVKSAMTYAGYSYDVAIVIADENLPTHLIDQLEVFGVKPIIHAPIVADLFVDRYLAFKSFLLDNPQYKTMLHVDVTDLFFQDNPFRHFDNSKLTFSSEDIEIQKETWNNNVLSSIYGHEKLNIIGNNNVVCGGVIGGPSNLYIALADKIEEESRLYPSSVRGSDQPYLQHILYQNDFLKENRSIKTLNDSFCINLHTCFYYPDLYADRYINQYNKVLYNSNNEKFAIVHQYNRISELYKNVTEHYKTYFSPL